MESVINWIASYALSLPIVVLFLLLVLGIYVVYRAQQRPDFDFAQMLISDGKPSSTRLAVFVSLALSTWVIMYTCITTTSKTGSISSEFVNLFSIYVVTWSGSKVLESLISAWAAKVTNKIPS
jgi:cbb3-type cytochrome oxidase subunit 3